ncbi:hypothetical protein Tco_0348349 [Tanacetum coccineum]
MLSFSYLIKSGLVISFMNLDTLKHFVAPLTCKLLALKRSMNASLDSPFYAMKFYAIYACTSSAGKFLRSSSGSLVPSHVFTLADIQSHFEKINWQIQSVKGVVALLLYGRDKSSSLMSNFCFFDFDFQCPHSLFSLS